MPQTMWNAADRQAILDRFDRLAPDARPKWGKFDAPRMVAHVTDTVRWSIGELTVVPMGKSPIGFWPVNALIMFYLPWPKGVPTAPERRVRPHQRRAMGTADLSPPRSSPHAVWSLEP